MILYRVYFFFFGANIECTYPFYIECTYPFIYCTNLMILYLCTTINFSIKFEVLYIRFFRGYRVPGSCFLGWCLCLLECLKLCSKNCLHCNDFEDPLYSIPIYCYLK